MTNNTVWFCIESMTSGHRCCLHRERENITWEGFNFSRRFSHSFVHASAIQPSPSGSSNFPSSVNLTFRVKGSDGGYCLLHLLHFRSGDFIFLWHKEKEEIKQIVACSMKQHQS